MKLIERGVRLLRKFLDRFSRKKRFPSLMLVSVRDSRLGEFREILVDQGTSIKKLERVYGEGNVMRSYGVLVRK